MNKDKAFKKNFLVSEGMTKQEVIEIMKLQNFGGNSL